jgi:hypothetical protein
LVLSAEDAVADTIRPRLQAAAGDVVLVTIEPITSYMGSIDSHRTTDVRAVLD